MIAVVTVEMIWKIPEEYEEYKKYCDENPSIMIERTSRTAITTNKYTHICEKTEEKNV